MKKEITLDPVIQQSFDRTLLKIPNLFPDESITGNKKFRKRRHKYFMRKAFYRMAYTLKKNPLFPPINGHVLRMRRYDINHVSLDLIIGTYINSLQMKINKKKRNRIKKYFRTRMDKIPFFYPIIDIDHNGDHL